VFQVLVVVDIGLPVAVVVMWHQARRLEVVGMDLALYLVDLMLEVQVVMERDKLVVMD
tara:strand:+ start:260 stop:433 length:174 start_codon:yes stop_codon:yes gene_type:complete